MYNPRNCPGPGDEITWPICAAHPNDPRAPDDDRPWGELLDDERRVRLADLSHDEIVELYLEACHDIEDLEYKIKRLSKAKA